MLKLIILFTIIAVTIARSVDNGVSLSILNDSKIVNPTFIKRPRSGVEYSPIESNSSPASDESQIEGHHSDDDKSKILLFDRFRPLHATRRPDVDNVTQVVIVAINSTVNYNAGIVQIVNNITAAMGPASVDLTNPTTN